jgi:hypothetical protein
VAHGAEGGSKPSKSCSEKKKRASAEEELALGANMLVAGANMLVTTASILWIRSMIPVPAPKTGGAGGGSANVRSVRFVQNDSVEITEPYSFFAVMTEKETTWNPLRSFQVHMTSC